MASIKFSYHSESPSAKIEIRLSYRQNDKQKSLRTRTDIETTRKWWDDFGTNADKWRDADKVKKRDEVRERLSKLRTYVFENLPHEDEVTPDWLKTTVYNFYNPKKKESLPSTLTGYWDYYMNLREYELKEKPRNWQKWNEVKNRVAKFETFKNRTYKLKDVDEVFKSDFVKYCKAQKYANATIKKNFSYIKMICTHAYGKGLEISNDLNNLRISLRNEDLPKVYLTLDELEIIEALEGLPSYLDNARDWLIVSCYTGQRVSDFMRFNTEMIRETSGRKYIDVTQKKTAKKVAIPLLKKVEAVLNKYNGEFPKAISPQRYNDYVKEVGIIAGLDSPTRGKILKKIAKGKHRKITGVYPKHELITSHIGRRSLATNFYGVIPSSFLKNITGHGTEAMLLAYIGKTSKDTAKETYDLLSKLNF